jgi:hypothetical protein
VVSSARSAAKVQLLVLAVLPDTTHMQLTQRAELVVPIVERFLNQGR